MLPRRTAATMSGLVLALPLALAGCSEDADAPAAEQTPRGLVTPSRLDVADEIPQAGRPQLVSVTVEDGEVTGDTGVVDVRVDSLVRVTVLADVLDTVTIEGYGLDFRTEVGRPVQEEFPARQAGTFEVRLRDSDRLLTTLRVA